MSGNQQQRKLRIGKKNCSFYIPKHVRMKFHLKFTHFIIFFSSWEKGLHAVLRGNLLCIYKDSKHFKQEPEKYLRGEKPIDLSQVVAEIPADYTKRKHVFRLKLPDGGEYLFEAPNSVRLSIYY